MCMHKGELANINPPRITTEPSLLYKNEGVHCSLGDLNIISQTKGRISRFLGSAKSF